MTEDYFNYFCANRRAINEAIRNEKSIINGGGGETGPKSNELWYTTSNELTITLYGTTGLPKIISNKYKNGKGVIKFAEDITILVDYMFNGSGSLLMTSITMPNSITSIGNSAFSDCTGLTSVAIPNSVTSIGENAFNGCTSLTSVIIGNNVKSIGGDAFDGCTSLTSITIPDSVTSIGNWAFATCRKLTSVTIGSGVTSIGNQAFNLCFGLTSVTCEATIPPTLGTNVFHYVPSSIPLYVPKGTVSAYEATAWSYFTNILEIGTVAYTITWLNWDGSVLSQKMVAVDTLPVYPGTTPTKPATAEYTYVFTGWSPNPVKVTGNTSYTAQFESEKIVEYVDLGLPSGNLWAKCNMGASSETEYGDYYSWGETETKANFSWSNYKYGSKSGSTYTLTKYNQLDQKTVLDLSDDAAYVAYGGNWRIPRALDYQELLDTTKVTNEYTSKDGVNGYEFTSLINGNKLFIPAAGFYSSELGAVVKIGTTAYVISCELEGGSHIAKWITCKMLYAGNDKILFPTNSGDRACGLSIRPVRVNN